MERGGRKAATRGDGWSAPSSGILQMGCLCVNAWCVVSFSPGGIVRPMLNAEESVNVWRKTAEQAKHHLETEHPFLFLTGKPSKVHF